MNKFAAAFVKAQREFAPAIKTATNPHFRSKYASLDSCVEAVIDALNNNGIALIQETSECSDGVIVETVFLHESGEERKCGKLHVPASKNDPPGYGSALTYARRYSLMAACGHAPEDDDGNAASGTPANKIAIPQRPQDTLPEYPDDQYKANLPIWQDAINKDKSTPQRIIGMISTKYRPSKAQADAIRELKKQVPDAQNKAELDQMLADIDAAERAAIQGNM